uniref:Putative ovule protein n=1 Tax=Solanum chacoense TaxID=4108 RepID=A0A0V0HW91_SOLCH
MGGILVPVLSNLAWTCRLTRKYSTMGPDLAVPSWIVKLLVLVLGSGGMDPSADTAARIRPINVYHDIYKYILIEGIELKLIKCNSLSTLNILFIRYLV